jgi:beta-glucanase (GH16 family)
MVFTFLDPRAAQAGADTPPLKATPDGRPLDLVFADNFQPFRSWTGHSGIWRTAFGGSERGRLNPFSGQKGVLEITALPAPDGMRPEVADYPYLSGLITTQPSFAQTYGYFEMRAELPRGKGLWPAFWMLPQDESWPPEIDVVESIGDPSLIYMTAHSKVAKAKAVEARIAPNVFHAFAVSWDARQLIWYIDGIEAGRVPTPADMHKPMYMLANLATGGTWPGAPDATTQFPTKLMIDYIRAYRFEL